MEFLFWFSAVTAVYAYTFFPGALWIASIVVRLGRTRGCCVAEQPLANGEPFSMIVAAHNEEANIVRKIEQVLAALALDPKNELIIVSDHSTDRTIMAAQSIVHPRIRATFMRSDCDQKLPWSVMHLLPVWLIWG